MIDTLKKYNQNALAAYLEKADEADRKAIEKQLAQIHWDELSG